MTDANGGFDEMDIELLRCVESDFDVSLDALSEELDLSKSAVHYRLNKLKDRGVIEGVTADLDPLSFGLDMVAITEVSVTHEQGYSESIGADLAALAGVEQVYYTMGDVDFVVISRVQDRTQMNAVIEEMVAVEGVNETSSRFVMDEITSRPRVIDAMPEAARSRVVEE
ncbi:Lrp/AsnC family transcriptional regulator [Halopenitus persicus]|uniref:DNA-binding transcriptional regulator, Lrp family n=1 Tax=Halopenitus persicus TaxID=1048396 RepID=A0A1H3E400_9EURY|nr:Lrp/AsnC family transcriptional regulator [Halopenitus persicus]QHS16484.1 Lrp/AsnC family transcriptional regulator [haloarchaeon 3A1-DGR]SDX73396.1 DNA-binding transcriptional regulator, Lrp family [Halopenitus persicus]